jgi:hypothetical protein
MANTIAQKLRIKRGYSILAINAPADFSNKLGVTPPGVKIINQGKNYNQLHWFVMNKAQLDKEMDKVLKLLKNDVVLWTYYPKGTSKIQTDLTRDRGWDKFLKHDELAWISLISFDETWSTFGSRLKTETDKKKDAKPSVREIFNWVNPKTKEIKLPSDFTAALKKNKKQSEFFNSLSFTNKKEYIEWIVTAKRKETRDERLNGSIERLAKNWKNPRNM